MLQKVLSFLSRLWKKPVARLVTSVLILILLLLNLPLADLWDTLARLSPGVWFFAVAVFVGAHGIGAAKWTLLINTGEDKVPYSAALRYHFAGLFANLFLPSIAGGDVVRAGLAIRSSSEKEAVVLGSLLDRVLDVCALALIVAVGVLLSPVALAAEDRSLLLVVLGLLGVAALGGAGLLVVPLPKRTPSKLVKVVERVRYGLQQLLKHPQRALIGLSLSVFMQAGFVLLTAFLGASVGIEPGLAVWFFAWPLAKLSATLPISIGGLGVREAALAVLLGRFGVSTAHAVGIGLLWQTVLLAGGAVGGISYYFLHRRASYRQDLAAAENALEEEASLDTARLEEAQS